MKTIYYLSNEDLKTLYDAGRLLSQIADGGYFTANDILTVGNYRNYDDNGNIKDGVMFQNMGVLRNNIKYQKGDN